MSLHKSLHFFMITIALLSCRKSDFLDARPDQSVTVPESIEDLQALLDNDQFMNGTGGLGGIVPALGELACTDYYISDGDLNSFIAPFERNAYTWQKQLYTGEPVTDWNFPYRSVFYTNVALDGISKINPAPAEQAAWNNVKGSALFYRAHMFYQLAQVFANVYDSATAATDWGIPLKLQADINETITRATMKENYDRIINDLHEALLLLPERPLYPTRPSKAAVYGLLARIYLNMRNYPDALNYANSCLLLQSALMDYNNFDAGVLFPVPQFNEETIFYCLLVEHTIMVPYVAGIDTMLIRSYSKDDLRKQLFFTPGLADGGQIFQGSYDGSGYLFAGIATDEIYLIRAECYARKGDKSNALLAINTLLEKRYKAGSFTPVSATTAADALMQIIEERKKELLMRGLRWSDLRRLNKEQQFAVTLSRTVNGINYKLPPNDLRYTYPLPNEVINYNPGMPQNPR